MIWLQLLRSAHIVSAAVIFGTGFGIAFFTWFGYRSATRAGDIGALRLVLRYTVVADACFTAPAVAFQAASGLALMKAYSWPMLSPWAIAVWALFLLAGACWLPVLYIKARMHRESRQAASIDALPAWFHAWFRRWFALGVPAFLCVIAIYWLMVAKPLVVA